MHVRGNKLIRGRWIVKGKQIRFSGFPLPALRLSRPGTLIILPPVVKRVWIWGGLIVLTSAIQGLQAQTGSARIKPKSNAKTYAGYLMSDALRIGAAPAWWKTGDWLEAGLLAAGTGTLVWQDENIRDAFQRNRTNTTNRISDVFNFFGGPVAAPALAGAFAAGVVFKKPGLQATAVDGWEASFFALSWCEFIKVAASRARPFQNEGVWRREGFSASSSFPSGHTTLAFALATTVSSHYPKLWVKMASYGMAAGVGLARMNDDKHFASDVLVGAALGTAVAHTIFKRNRARRRALPAR